MNCECETIKKYDDEYRCMECYKQFVPKDEDINSRIVDEWTAEFEPFVQESGIQKAGTG